MPETFDRLKAALADRYRLKRELGAGGMATVYLAEDLKHHRQVAIKVLKPELAAALGPQRFLREIDIVAKLSHPHVLPLHDSGEAESFLYYVMPYVEGESLREKLNREKQVSIEESIEITKGVASALDYAHRHDVIHRDIKPENILLHEGEALVTDFGIALAVWEAGGERLTETGLAVGTPAYMSPEQASGERELNARSDVYSLGCVLYEMLVGEPPYTGPTAEAIFAKRLTDPVPSPRRLRETIPREMNDAVQKALAKLPADRFATAAEFMAALEARTVPQPPAGRLAVEGAVAVLDFANVSGDPAFAWLSSGIAETVTVDLKKAAALRVISRDKIIRRQTATATEDVTEANVADLGRRLAARWVVWGGFQVFGSAIRITAQFRESETDELVGAAKIDGPLDDLFDLQDRVVTSLLEALEVELSASDLERIGKPETVKLEAYECYAKGRQAVSRLDPDSVEAAREYFEQAVAADPSYALAYGGLGSVFAVRYISTTRSDDLEQAVRYLERAVALDPDLALPHAWLAYAYLRREQFEAAERMGCRAVELDPGDPLTHYMLGLAHLGHAFADARPERFGRAVGPLVRAIRLEREFHQPHLMLGELCIALGQYGAARALLDRAVAMETSDRYREFRFVGSLATRGWLHLRENQLDDALADFQRSVHLLQRVQHVYRDAFTVLSYCGMAEVAYRRGAHDVAIEHYGRARELAEESSHKLGMGYLLIRSLVGLARAFHRLHMRREEAAHLAAASDLFTRREGYNFQWVTEGNDIRAWVDFVTYHAAAGQRAECLNWLRKAVDGGWRDLGLIATDENFGAFASDQEFDALRERLNNRPELAPELADLLRELHTGVGIPQTAT